jgi:uncharacterized protein YecT (DUF1311 family)
VTLLACAPLRAVHAAGQPTEEQLEASAPEHRDALRKAQEAWQKYCEADLVAGGLETEGGSGRAVYGMQRHVYQLRLRIYQLSTDFLQGWVPIPKVDEPAMK